MERQFTTNASGSRAQRPDSRRKDAQGEYSADSVFRVVFWFEGSCPIRRNTPDSQQRHPYLCRRRSRRRPGPFGKHSSANSGGNRLCWQHLHRRSLGRSNIVVDTAGKIRVVAGSGVENFNGNGGPAKNASLDMGVDNVPNGIAVDRNGNIFFVDKFNNQIRMVDASTGAITTFAGSGTGGYSSGGYSGDGGPATSASLNLPGEIAFDTNGNLFIADSQNGRIRRVDASTGMITTVAGNGGFT